jgi:hypothetical protein
MTYRIEYSIGEVDEQGQGGIPTLQAAQVQADKLQAQWEHEGSDDDEPHNFRVVEECIEVEPSDLWGASDPRNGIPQ